MSLAGERCVGLDSILEIESTLFPWKVPSDNELWIARNVRGNITITTRPTPITASTSQSSRRDNLEVWKLCHPKSLLCTRYSSLKESKLKQMLIVFELGSLDWLTVGVLGIWSLVDWHEPNLVSVVPFWLIWTNSDMSRLENSLDWTTRRLKFISAFLINLKVRSIKDSRWEISRLTSKA